MSSEFELKEYYIGYLQDIRKLSKTSIKHYLDAIKYISNYLCDKKKIQDSLYEIKNIYELEIIRAYLYNQPDFVDLDKRGHQMYSAALNNYLRFANGEGFTNIKGQIEVMDVAVPIGKKIKVEHSGWSRSSIIKKQVIESANYQCEIDDSHKTFTAKSTNHQYMEGHHAIPINLQDKFQNSLDIYANVICLCPICHRLLHYGVENEKKVLLDKIYNDRAERLVNSGIVVSKNEFIDMVI